jgi:DNA polymerase V
MRYDNLYSEYFQSQTLMICEADTSTSLSLQFIDSGIQAGFPSPAEDYVDLAIDLNQELIKNPSSTFLGRVKGSSMKDAGIFEGDVLIIDKSKEPQDGSIAVCFLDGDFTVKRIKISGKRCFLMPANEAFSPIEIHPDNDFRVWGIVTYIIKKV